MKRRSILKTAVAGITVAASIGWSAIGADAQEVTLKLHQFLPPQATIPAKFLIPWGKKIEEESNGRIKVEIYSAMALGGRPPELIDQAADGVVDIAWTLPGYTPGRYPRVEVFELPFMMTNAEATSRAYWDLFEGEMKDTDFKDLKILAAWVHGPGVFHVKGDGIRKLEDLKGLKLRGPTRIINGMLEELGATPVGMPVPAVPEALSKGVIDGTVIPWEVTTALKVAELTNTHTDFAGDHALYTAAFVLAMNKAKYDSLPDDLKAVIDANSGQETSAWAARETESGDAPGKKVAVDRGNTIITLDEAETARWKEAAQPVVDRWIAEMKEKGVDGQKLLDEARALIDKYTKM